MSKIVCKNLIAIYPNIQKFVLIIPQYCVQYVFYISGNQSLLWVGNGNATYKKSHVNALKCINTSHTSATIASSSFATTIERNPSANLPSIPFFAKVYPTTTIVSSSTKKLPLDERINTSRENWWTMLKVMWKRVETTLRLGPKSSLQPTGTKPRRER